MREISRSFCPFKLSLPLITQTIITNSNNVRAKVSLMYLGSRCRGQGSKWKIWTHTHIQFITRTINVQWKCKLGEGFLRRRRRRHLRHLKNSEFFFFFDRQTDRQTYQQPTDRQKDRHCGSLGSYTSKNMGEPGIIFLMLFFIIIILEEKYYCTDSRLETSLSFSDPFIRYTYKI